MTQLTYLKTDRWADGSMRWNVLSDPTRPGTGLIGAVILSGPKGTIGFLPYISGNQITPDQLHDIAMFMNRMRDEFRLVQFDAQADRDFTSAPSTEGPHDDDHSRHDRFSRPGTDANGCASDVAIVVQPATAE